jgi:hypothetical protein
MLLADTPTGLGPGSALVFHPIWRQLLRPGNTVKAGQWGSPAGLPAQADSACHLWATLCPPPLCL